MPPEAGGRRYEPFRAKAASFLSDAYRRPIWGEATAGYRRVLDGLREGSSRFVRLDAAQLVKHGFGLRTAVHHKKQFSGKLPVLLYLYAEPERWPDGRPIPRADIEAHRVEIRKFAEAVAGDEVVFQACSYRELGRRVLCTDPRSRGGDRNAVRPLGYLSLMAGRPTWPASACGWAGRTS